MNPTMAKLLPFISLALLIVAGVVIHHEIHLYHWQEIKSDLLGIPTQTLFGMAGLTLLGYLALSLYDYLALEYAGEKLPYQRVLLTSFLGYAISNNVGHSLVSGGSLRFRLYSGWGISATAIAKVVIFCSVTYIIGALTMMVGSYLLLPGQVQTLHNLSGQHLLPLMIAAAVGLLLLWWGLVLFYRRPVTIRAFSLNVPGLSLAVRQNLVALLDLLLAAAALYLAICHYAEMPFTSFLLIFIIAQLAGLFSQVPGGIGIFEGSFLLLTSGDYPSSQILAALIAFRAVYYFSPLLVAGILLAIYELKPHTWFASDSLFRATLATVESMLPHAYFVLLLLGGSVLLLSGAVPAVPERLQWLHFILPLPLIEFSHLIGSMAGLCMLFLAFAVRQRMDSAYYATVIVLCVGLVASLGKGWDFEEATVMAILLLLFIPARKHFYRMQPL